MNESNLFWSVYKNLEQETINVAKYVYFSSDQKYVYSNGIADLIVRCAVEIEALSKKIYESLGGDMHPKKRDGTERTLCFDTDCLKLIDKKYQISKKKIIISAPTFDFVTEDQIITPLYNTDKKGKRGSNWEQAYQALKHDRYKSLKDWATVDNLVNILGALFLLNIYYKDTIYLLPEGTKTFDDRLDSIVFSILVYDASNIDISKDLRDDRCIMSESFDNMDSATYILKRTDENFRALREAIIKDSKETEQNIRQCTEITDYLKENPDYKPKNNLEMVQKICGKEKASEIISRQDIYRSFIVTEREAVLNKHQNIYTID